MKTACFTGHRNMDCDLEDLKSRLYNALERAIVNAGITDFYNGGAVGWDILTAQTVLQQADSIEQISEHYFNGCMKQRNARMIELSDCCFCYWNGNMKSGTVQTIRMAQRKHIPIVNFCHD